MKVLLAAVAIWAITLVLGAGAVLGADFGLPTWVLIPALLWLATVGAPTTAGVLLVAWVWGLVPGLNGLGAFLCLGCLAGLAFELAGCVAAKRWLSTRTRPDS